MRIRVIPGLSFLLLLAAAFRAPAQPARFFSGQKIEARDGLSAINIRKIITDAYGFYWAASQDGLVRYDGVRFHQFTSGATESGKDLLGSDVYDLCADEAGNELYALTAYGGLNIISPRENVVKKRIPISMRGKPAPWLRSCAGTGSFVYCGSNNGLLFRYNKNRQAQDVAISLAEQFEPRDSGVVSRILADNFDRVWVCIDKVGVLVVDASLHNKLFFFPTYNNADFNGICIYRNTIVCTTNRGIQQFSLQNPATRVTGPMLANLPDALKSEKIKCATANDESLFVTTSEGLYLYKNDRWKQYVLSNDKDERNWLVNTNTIYAKDSTLLFGAQYGLLFVKNLYSPFAYFSAFQENDQNNVNIPHATTICSDGDSIVFSASTTHIFRINSHTGSIKKFAPSDFYFNIFPPAKNQLMVSGDATKMRLYKYDGIPLSLSAHYPELKRLADTTYLIGATPYRDSLFLLACEQPKQGLIIWNKLKKTTRLINTTTQPVALQSDIINRVFVDRANNIWIVCDDAISIYNHERDTIRHLMLKHPGSGEALRINMDICESTRHYWLAVYGMGIVKLRKDYTIDTVFAFREGLKSVSLYKIFNYRDSLILASSNLGLIVLQVSTGRVITYFQNDGLMSDNFEETGGYQTQQAVYFGGARGIVRVDPEKFNFNPHPLRLYFTDLEIVKNDSVINKFDLEETYFRVPFDYDRVTLNFTALGAVYADKIQFQFRIREKGIEWTNLGNRRFVDLTGLSPGTYHIQIKAADETGTWSEVKTLTLRFLPRWYQTLGFKIGVGLLLFSLAYAFYRYRIRQIRKQQQIRRNIASDLHDDIGSTLNSVKVYTHLALEGKEKEQYLQMARQNLEEASISLRDMIWVLDDKLDTADELLTRVKQFAFPLANALSIETDFKCDHEIQQLSLSKEEKRNFLLICKEAVNNSIKYSGATQITVHFTTAKKKIKLLIADNGKGFHMQTITPGNGLKNMQYRAGQIGYVYTLTAEPGKGTSIVVKPV